MSYDYDALYAEQRDALGAPTDAIVDFFTQYQAEAARVLDLGCGQGRDALFIARMGHHVTGVDIAPHGIGDLRAQAAEENLAIEGVVADLVSYRPEGLFDVVLLDRTLHMLEPAPRLEVLARALMHVARSGWLLILDEPSNISDFVSCVQRFPEPWQIATQRRGLLFVKRGGAAPQVAR